MNQLLHKKKFHPSLKIVLPKRLSIKKFSPHILSQKWDLIVIAVSSIGIELIRKHLKGFKQKTSILVLTKGLKYDRKINKIITMSEQLSIGNKNLNKNNKRNLCPSNNTISSNNL